MASTTVNPSPSDRWGDTYTEADAIRAWLPQLAATANLAGRVAAAAHRELGEEPHSHYLDDFCSRLCAKVVLDGLSVEEATDAQCAEHWAGKNPVFVAVVRGGTVQDLLEKAAQGRQELPAAPVPQTGR